MLLSVSSATHTCISRNPHAGCDNSTSGQFRGRTRLVDPAELSVDGCCAHFVCEQGGREVLDEVVGDGVEDVYGCDVEDLGDAVDDSISMSILWV